ncbi:MAG TPA: DUF1003 domain-containing protein [Phototrophicaceae bacterium]|nr:DUF1003 domain-containing protein [Phototrophicaceae bacterium]
MYNDLLLNRLVAPEDNEDEQIQDLIDEIEELDSLLSPEAQELIRDLRPYIVSDDVYEDIDEQASFGERVADWTATFQGSWKFIFVFALIMAIWIVSNATLGHNAFDPYPFILLNLTLSTYAAFSTPLILMAQNRQSAKDRAVAQNDFHVNLKSEVEIADLHRKIDGLTDALTMQTKLVNVLVEARRKELTATKRRIEHKRGDLNGNGSSGSQLQ